MKPDFTVHLAHLRDIGPAVTRCTFCDFRFEGTALEGREGFQAHLLEVHPDRAKESAAVKRLLRRVQEMEDISGASDGVVTARREA